MKNLFKLFSICFLSFCSCQQKGAEYKSLSVEDFASEIANSEVQRLDVRTVAEYTEGHIPGCININVLDEANFSPMAEEMLDKEKPVALYCRSGKRSKKAAHILSKKGYKVLELDKGFNAWQAAGKEVEK